MTLRPVGTVRVASYNIRDLRDDVDAAARVVRSIDPDVLCLQEVPRFLLGSERVSAFARRCAMFWSGAHGGSGGTTIMTSLRVVADDVSHHRLPTPPTRPGRGYAVARVRLPGHLPLTAVCVHLGLDEPERVRHAATIVASIGASTPLVIAGDLNEREGGAARAQLAVGRAQVSSTSATFPARRPRAAIDVVLASPDLRVAEPAEVPLAGSDVIAGSDHWPVWVDLRLPALPDAR